MREDALDRLSAAADAGDFSAMDELATRLYRDGDEAGAQHWFQNAAYTGDPGAMAKLGMLHERQGELALAERWYRKAREHNEPRAMWATGRLARQWGDEVAALSWFRRAAAAGDSQARIDLMPWLVERGEVQEAEHWAHIAGEGADVRGVYFAGTVLEGLGKPADAERLYRKAAEAGYRDALEKMKTIAAGQGDQAAVDRNQAMMLQASPQWVEQTGNPLLSGEWE